MSKLLESVARARIVRDEATQKRDRAQAAFVTAVRKARDRHSWAEIAEVAHLSASGVRFLLGEIRRKENGNDGTR